MNPLHLLCTAYKAPNCCWIARSKSTFFPVVVLLLSILVDVVINLCSGRQPAAFLVLRILCVYFSNKNVHWRISWLTQQCQTYLSCEHITFRNCWESQTPAKASLPCRSPLISAEIAVCPFFVTYILITFICQCLLNRSRHMNNRACENSTTRKSSIRLSSQLSSFLKRWGQGGESVCVPLGRGRRRWRRGEVEEWSFVIGNINFEGINKATLVSKFLPSRRAQIFLSDLKASSNISLLLIVRRIEPYLSLLSQKYCLMNETLLFKEIFEYSCTLSPNVYSIFWECSTFDSTTQKFEKKPRSIVWNERLLSWTLSIFWPYGNIELLSYTNICRTNLALQTRLELASVSGLHKHQYPIFECTSSENALF